jgi:site-specific DNA-cytosine methylase
MATAAAAAEPAASWSGSEACPYAIDLFSGIGGMALAVHAVADGLRMRCACDCEADCRAVMAARFRDVLTPGPAALHADVRALRAAPGSASLVYGGFPCQDVSHAGRQLGVVQGGRSSLFGEMIRIAAEAGAGYIFLENVSALAANGLDVVLARLAEAGWGDVRAATVAASEVGARHRRRRIFILARNAALAGAAPPIVYRPASPERAAGSFWDDAAEPAPRLSEPGTKMSPAWRARVRMLGNTCVPQQGEAALRFLLTGGGAEGGAHADGASWAGIAFGSPARPAGIAFGSPARPPGSEARPPARWCDLWEASRHLHAPLEVSGPSGSGAVAVPRVPPLTRRGADELCPTLIANDRQGGNLAGRMPDGSYRSMTLARWVRHMPERGSWGKADPEAHPLRRGVILRVPWAAWLMGFPPDWLELPLPCDVAGEEREAAGEGERGGEEREAAGEGHRGGAAEEAAVGAHPAAQGPRGARRAPKAAAGPSRPQ